MKLNCLNLGCGSKYHKEWTNIDFASNEPDVMNHNLLKGIPFSDNYFDVVYHSQVLEHFQKTEAEFFIRECFRVLKKGGIIRIVVPDLENIAKEYIRLIKENFDNPSSKSEADYDWIMLEMYDQTVRNKSGGLMSEFLSKKDLINSKYIESRIGYSDKSKRVKYYTNKQKSMKFLSRVSRFAKRNLKLFLNNFHSNKYKIGDFRSKGEIHFWMYDRFSISRLLKNNGFNNVQVMTPHNSNIPEWDKYELDKKDNMIFDPSGLFIEASK